MPLNNKEEIGTEQHTKTTKTIKRVQGTGLIMVGNVFKSVISGLIVMITPKTNHNVLSTSTTVLNLFKIYSPPVDEEGLIEKFKIESGDSSIKGKTILLIDDEPMVTDICEMMLKRLGHKVLKAHSGSEGIQIYEANTTRIDLIISDFNMPGMNGQEVVNTLRIMDHSVKVLLSSGGIGADEEKEVVVRGFDGFLKKPYSMNTLSNKIAEILS